ncbi:MAG TPA: hypothetical protein VIV60_24695 [Polyangiaceae bacterium]
MSTSYPERIGTILTLCVAQLGLAACTSSSSNANAGGAGATSASTVPNGTTSSGGGASTAQGGTSTSQGGDSSSSARTSGGTSSSPRTSGGSSSSTTNQPTSEGGTSQGGGSSANSVGGKPASTSTGTDAQSGGTTSSSGNVGGGPAVGGQISGSGGSTSTSSIAATGGVHQQATRPAGDPTSCGKSWALTEGVCCAQNCINDNLSESCDKCGGAGSDQCQIINHKACESGLWPEVHSVSDNESWHYSRSTHFGITAAGACAFGLYGLCTTKYKGIANQCDAFCKAYPLLCQDPENITLHGNFAAPQGNYYTQFWPSLPGDNDNYLSCGECFELMRTKKDGTEYQPSEAGYTQPIVIQVVDSCPCAPNSKWCCGSGRDHCGEVADFAYGCPLPPSPTPPANHDPSSAESIHFDLSDIAMARLQSGSPDGAMPDGVIPTKYRRIPCPVPGNIYLWMQANGSEYFFSFSVVNLAGLGAAAQVEARMPDGTWVALKRNSNYTMSRPQERYGTWATPQGAGPFALPVSIRITDGGGHQVVGEGAIKAWNASDAALKDMYYIDTGVQFTTH